MIAGVCGGFAETYGFDPSLIRLLVVFLGIVTGIAPMVLTYLFAWIIVPKN